MNWSKPLFPIPNTMLKWHKNHCPYIYILSKTKYSHTVVGWGSEWWTDLGNKEEIFIFRSSFYAIIDQHEIFDKKIPNLIIPKKSWFTITLNSVPDGYIAGAVYGIYQARNWVLWIAKLLINTQFLIKKDPICTFFKKI